jgi:hypothetical protein
MDVVQLEGGGDGFEGLGGGSGGPGKPEPSGPAGDKEFVENVNPGSPLSKPNSTDVKLSDPERPVFDAPDVPASAFDASVLDSLDETSKAADELVRELMKLPKSPAASAKGSATGKGSGTKVGKGGGPVGPGVGNKKGTGTGRGGGPGREATRQEILAYRWRFDIAGNGKEHAKKLDAAGLILAVPDGRGNAFIIRDLKRRPVELGNENLEPFQDAVKWYNVRPDSIRNLAQELRLSFVPQFLVLLLPKEREEKMMLEEARHAKEKGRDPGDISATWFDFRLQNGTYAPVVIRQEYAK